MTKISIHYFKTLINSGGERSVIVKKNAIGSLLIKVMAMVIDFIKVPLLLSYLDSERYGLYITISSIVYWAHNFDFGLGTGLRYKLTTAISKKNYYEGKKLVSTAYISLSGIMILVLLILFPIIDIIDWSKLLNSQNIPNPILIKCVAVVFVVFIIQFILELITYILQAYQKAALSSLFKPIANATTLLVIVVLKIFTNGNLLFACFGMTIPIVIVLFISNIILFNNLCKQVKPSPKYFDRNNLKDIYSLGLKYFISQISNLVIFQSTAFLISHYVDPSEAAAYTTSYTYFGIIMVFNGTMLIPLSASITDAYIKDEFNWIKNIMHKIHKISKILTVISILLLLISPIIFKIWIDDKLYISWMLRIFMSLYFILNIWTTPYSAFISGVGKMNIAMWSNIVKIIVFFPIAIIIVKYLGTWGIMLAIILVNTIPNNVLYTIQYKKIVNRTATGIWNK